MRYHILRWAAVLGLSLLSTACATASNDAEEAHQARCELDSKADFDIRSAALKAKAFQVHQTNDYRDIRYSQHLKQCTYVLSSHHSDMRRGWGKGQSLYAHAQLLVDPQQGWIIGTYFKLRDKPAPSECWLEAQRCSSQEEWESLLRAYFQS